MRTPPPERDRRAVLCLSPRGLDHHFEGLTQSLAREGLYAILETQQVHAPLRVTPDMARRSGAMLHADAVHANAAGIRAAASAAGTPLFLLMDGIADHANTFLNPRAGHDLLRPAPADITLAAGPLDREILRALGNPAIATGLPRLSAFAHRAANTPSRERRGILIASANTPAFTRGGRQRLLHVYAALHAAAQHHRVNVRWRIAPDLARELNVPRDQDPLVESLAAVQAVLTPASTLALEAMLAGVPTALLHPHPWPLWLPAAWTWHASDLTHDQGPLHASWNEDLGRVLALEGADAPANAAAARMAHPIFRSCRPFAAPSADALLSAILNPSADLLALQHRVRRCCVRDRAPRRIARLLAHVVPSDRATDTSTSRRPRVQIVSAPREPHTLAPRRLPRVVCCIEDHASSVGGVSVWSARMEALAADHPELGFEWVTLFITAGRVTPTERLAQRPFACVCSIDPTASTLHTRTAIDQALHALDASVVLPNYSTHAFAAALHARARGTAVVAIAHTNDDYYRQLLADFDQWDAAVAVSPECTRWVHALAGTRPVRTIACGVPLPPPSPRVRTAGPLRLGYVGRVVEKQKRVSDLLRLLHELHHHGVSFEFHMVGDGEALDAWCAAAANLQLPVGTLHVHGPRTAQWVQEFWPTLDCNVITSDAEGTSVAMLESMAAGVLPCITRVDDAIDQLLTDGLNAIIVPVGDMASMAQRLAELSTDRPRVLHMGERVRRVIIDRGLTLEACGLQYRELIEALAALPPNRRPPIPFDGGLAQPGASYVTRGAAFESEIEGFLRSGGYDNILHSRASIPPTLPKAEPSAQHATAIVISGNDEHPGADQIAAWRTQGFGVAVAPSLSAEAPTHVTSYAHALREQGLTRLALFAPGHFTTAAAEWLAREARDIIVGVVVPGAPSGATFLGLPAWNIDHAIAQQPQAVLHPGRPDDLTIFAAAWPLRGAGIPLFPQLNQPALAAHVDRLLTAASEALRRGGRVATTAPFPLLQGVQRTEIGPFATSKSTATLLLPGDETDFEHAAYVHASLGSATHVHSLRWSDDELHSPQRFARAVRDLAAHSTDRDSPPRYALYGAGLHTRRLLLHGAPPHQPACIFDDRAAPNATLSNIPVVTPDRAMSLRISCVILSSPAHERTLWRSTAPLRDAGILVIPLYHTLDQLHDTAPLPA